MRSIGLSLLHCGEINSSLAKALSGKYLASCNQFVAPLEAIPAPATGDGPLCDDVCFDEMTDQEGTNDLSPHLPLVPCPLKTPLQLLLAELTKLTKAVI